MSDRSGQLLGNYRMVRLLGQGGFSDVYLGEHIHLNTYAAVKILRTQLAEDGIDNFRTEARMLAHLKHPNIVQVLDFGVEDMTPYLIMQYAPNGTLRQRHPRGVPVALNVVISYVQQMASALQYAHNQKLIHRDIKPENMLVGEQNQVLLSDFGIAVVTASAHAADPAHASTSWELAGTASYMAPEQIQGKTVPASDQYALAIVVYEWLTGATPFNGSYMEVVSQQISATPASLRAKVSSLAPEVEQVVLTALNKDPQRRFGHIEAFANALRQAAQSSPVSGVATDARKTSEVSKMAAVLISSLGRIVIGTTKVTIGRAPDNTIVLSDAKASSRHTEIRPEGQYYSLVDLGSTNGTFVNEQQVNSRVPRILQPGDTVRIGDTAFTFIVISAPQATSDGSTERATPSPSANPAATPNFAGNTSYGMGNANYGHQDAIPAQSPSLTPYPGQQPAYTPPQPPYVSETQLSTYVPSSYGQTGQQPAYTPSQPAYTPPPPVYTPQSPQQPPQQQERSLVHAIVLAVIALVIILAGVSGFFIYHNNQVAQNNSNATATANAMATAHAQATTNVNATATAIATSHYPPFMNVSLDNSLTSSSSDWQHSSICQFNSVGYQVSIAKANTLQYCLNSGTFSDFAYQVNMHIQQGDCGGLIFRHIDNNNFFLFEVCQGGTYNLRTWVNDQEKDLYSSFHPSSVIQQGLNKQNIMAVIVQSDTVNMYVNGQNIDVATDQALTSSTFSQGGIGLMADDTPDPTAVTYSNALVWTK